MELHLLVTLLSFAVHFFLIVPFINILYRIKFQRAKQETRDVFDNPTPIFDRFHQHKHGTPVGGGILIVALSTILFALSLTTFSMMGTHITSNYNNVPGEVFIIFFTFISFALLGVYDDLHKILFLKRTKFFGMRMRHKLIIMTALALAIGYWLYSTLGISILYVPLLGVFDIGVWYVLFAAFVIVAFANAVNITDGLDGLASSLLIVALAGFWVIARSIIDVPTSLFIAIWLGGMLAFMYFNVYPARIFMGDTGALSFGATFAVIGLILGKPFALPIIGGVFVVEITTSLLQLLYKKFYRKKLFPVAPLHLWLQLRGWEEPKIVMRLLVFAILFSLLGLMMAFTR
ncbi:MAG: phospho-N-acetylmuramoyl-pentapeptide-transferase [Patescibacteria group bacterium]|nr:phospho-N-acetylmuramoyl-pentapeptide-transferase [Patescibacteria group bacterium]